MRGIVARVVHSRGRGGYALAVKLIESWKVHNGTKCDMVKIGYLSIGLSINI
jgi:hypothetical protein